MSYRGSSCPRPAAAHRDQKGTPETGPVNPPAHFIHSEGAPLPHSHPRPTPGPISRQAPTSRLLASLLPLILLLCTTPSATADPGLFLIDGRAPRTAIVTAPWAEPPADPDAVPESPMLRAITGVIADLTPRDLTALRRAADTKTRVPDDIALSSPLVSVHMKDRLASARVDLALVEHGWILATQSSPGRPPVRARLDDRVIADLLNSWPSARPNPNPDPNPDAGPLAPAGQPFQLAHPLTPSPIRLDEATASARFAAGRGSPFTDPMTRDLADERMFARLPVNHDPSRPAGLLVWISPTPSGVPPQSLYQAADKLNLVCVASENAGNDRTALDRIQLTLDAVATISERIWIDPDRVYACGMSGGGRISSMLWACFPDIFTGAVPIVGMNSHHAVPIGNGKYWPKSHADPRGDHARLLRTNRLAAISGQNDYNFREMQARTGRLRREHLAARLFDIAGLGHTMPTDDHITTAITWVDEAVMQARAASAGRVKPLLDRYLNEHGQTPPTNPRDAALLERVTTLAPWTDPAWTAAKLLGY